MGESPPGAWRLVGPHDPSSEALSCSSVPCRQQRGQQLHLSLCREGRASCRDPQGQDSPSPHHRPPPRPPQRAGQFCLGPESNTVSRGSEGGRRSCRGPWGWLRNSAAVRAPYPNISPAKTTSQRQVPGTPPSAPKLCHSSLTSGGPGFPAGPPSFQTLKVSGF